jgi:hypothetical protein
VVVADGTGDGKGEGDRIVTVGVGVTTVVAVVGREVLVSTCASGFIVYDVPPGKEICEPGSFKYTERVW